MGKKKYRLRDKQINIRVTDYEYALLQERMRKSGSASMTEFIIDAATNGFLINVDYSEIKTLSYELNRIGNNINQIAHRINSEGIVYKTEIKEVQEYMELIWKMMRSKFYQIP
jgi:predicted ABC-type ATPase